jgi:DNA-binding PadR family transcriptional regulator
VRKKTKKTKVMKKQSYVLGTRTMILAILLSGRTYGLDIIRECRRRTNGLLVPQQGNLYPILKKLEREKFVFSEIILRRSPLMGGRPSVHYELTPSGRREAEKVLYAIIRIFDLNVEG